MKRKDRNCTIIISFFFSDKKKIDTPDSTQFLNYFVSAWAAAGEFDFEKIFPHVQNGWKATRAEIPSNNE